LPELRFALGEPDLDITSIDNAAVALERRSYFIRKVGTDGFRIGYKPTLRKVVGDRRAALDETEVLAAMRDAVKKETEKGRVIPVYPLISDGAEVPDSPKLTLVALDPEIEWNPDGEIRKTLSGWTRNKGTSPRFYPAALLWLVRKLGRTLREKAELHLAWRRVANDLETGVLGSDIEPAERREVAGHIKESEEGLRDEVWASYRYAVIADAQGAEGMKEIDLGAGHASAAASLSARVIAALKAEGLLNESVGAGYIERNWPPALKDMGTWPLKGLRQAFLDGTLTRLLDPEEVLRRQIVTFVERGDFGLGSGPKDGSFQRVWWKEPIGREEVVFDDKTFLLAQARASSLKELPREPLPMPPPAAGDLVLVPPPSPGTEQPAADQVVRLSLRGTIPPEQWNKLGTKLLPKLRTSGQDLSLGLDASLTVRSQDLHHIEAELRQTLRDLGLEGLVRIEKEHG
jgi:hypothetical protein